MKAGNQHSKLRIHVAYELPSKVFQWLSPVGGQILAHFIENQRLFLDIESGKEFSAPFDCSHKVYEHNGRYLVFNADDHSTFCDLNTGTIAFTTRQMVYDVTLLDNQLAAQDIRDKRTFFNIESGDALFKAPVDVFTDVNRIDGHYLVQDCNDRTQFVDLRTGTVFRSPGIALSSLVNHVGGMYLVVALDSRTVVDIKTSQVVYNAPDDIMEYQVSDVFGHHVAKWGLNAARLFDLRSHELLAQAPTRMAEIQTINGRYLALSSLGNQFFEIGKA